MTVGKADPNYAAALGAVRQALAAVSGTDPRHRPALRRRIHRPDGRTGGSGGTAAAQTRSDTKEVSFYLVTAIQGLEETQRRRGQARRRRSGTARRRQEARPGSEAPGQPGRPVGDGVARLSAGATSLAAGIARLSGGTEALEQSLAEGFRRSYPLQAGLQRASVRVVSTGRLARTPRRRVCGAAPPASSTPATSSSRRSTAPPPPRANAPPKAIDLNRSGQAATMLVFSRYAFNTPGSIALQQAARRRRRELSAEKRPDDRRRRRRRRRSTTTAASPATGSRSSSPRSPSPPSSSWS